MAMIEQVVVCLVMIVDTTVHCTCREVGEEVRAGSNDDGEDLELVEMQQPPPIEKCAGYYVVRSDDGDREGLVDRVKPGTRTMLVMYENEDTDSAEVVEVPYDEPGLHWFREEDSVTGASLPSKSSAVQSGREDEAVAAAVDPKR